jgi:hypothetical protein
MGGLWVPGFVVAALRCIELLETWKRESIAYRTDLNDKLQRT